MTKRKISITCQVGLKVFLPVFVPKERMKSPLSVMLIVCITLVWYTLTK